MMDENISTNPRNVTRQIKDFFFRFPESSAKECCRLLSLDHKKYGNTCRVIKCQVKKWRKTILKEYYVTNEFGQPLVHPSSRRVVSHRIEYMTEVPIPADLLLLFCDVANRGERRKGVWYRIKNRNRQLQYFDDFVSVRIFPNSGTCRILSCRPMNFSELRNAVEKAFFEALAGKVSLERLELLVKQVVPHSRHKTFRVGPVTPFKIDHYKDSLGLTIRADGSHPEFIECSEDWPSWIKPQLHALSAQTEAITALTEQIKLHLEVMKGINEATKDLTVSTEMLRKTLEPKKPKPFDLRDWLRDVSKRKLT